jgi:hypothetical protein
MKVRWIALTIVAAAAVVALAVVFTRGEGTQAGSQAGLVMEGAGGDLAPYLVGYWRCDPPDDCTTDNTIFRFVNPSSETLQKDAALFDDDENIIACFNANLTQNDLEVDSLAQLLANGATETEPYLRAPVTGDAVTDLTVTDGVIKVVVLDPSIPNAIDALRSGLIGYADYTTDIDAGPAGTLDDVHTGLAELHGVPRAVVLEDAYGGPGQDVLGPDGRPDELAKIIDNCFPPEATPTPTVTPTVTNTPTATATVPTATPTSTPTPYVPVVTATPTPPEGTATPAGGCFEWPPGSGTIICF